MTISITEEQARVAIGSILTVAKQQQYIGYSDTIARNEAKRLAKVGLELIDQLPGDIGIAAESAALTLQRIVEE